MSVQLCFMLLHRVLIFNSPYPVQMFRSKKNCFLSLFLTYTSGMNFVQDVSLI